MATHWEPKPGDLRGGGGEHEAPAESVAEGERDAWWAEFNGLSEDEVRSRIERGQYSERIALYAREWLDSRRSLHLYEDTRAIRAFTQQCRDIANDAHKIAQDAREQARAASATIREASEKAALAYSALEQARASQRRTGAIAVFALLVAAAAIVSAVFPASLASFLASIRIF